MKKSKTIFACAMLVTLASCSNDHVLSQQSSTPSDPDVINIVAASSKAVTRAVVDDKEMQNTQFVANEQINVYLSENLDGASTSVINYTQPMVYTVSSTLDSGYGVQLDPPSGEKPKFPSNNHGVDAFALYPTDVNTETSQTFSVQLDQSAYTNYRKSDMMFGTNSLKSNGDPQDASFKGTLKGNNVQLYFKHQLSKIIVKMDKNSFDDGTLTNAEIHLLSAKNGSSYTAGASGITLQDPTTALSDGEYYNLGIYNENGNAGIIIPQTISNDDKFIEIVLSDNTTKYVYKIDEASGTQFQGGKQYTYTIKLSGGNLVVVSVKIKDWEDVQKEGTADLESSN